MSRPPPSPATFDLAAAGRPATRKIPKDVTVHGDERSDDYGWLRDAHDPVVRAQLANENAYTDSVLAPGRALSAALFTEMRARLKEDDCSAKTPFLGYLYYTRTEKDQQYEIHCRIRDLPGATEEILVDLNALGRDRAYVDLGQFEVSDDGLRLAYSIDWTGYRQYEVFVLDFATGTALAQPVGLVADVVWGAGHEVFYFITENEAKRPDKLHRWTASTGLTELLYEETDALFNLELKRSRDGCYVFCESASKVTTEVRVLRTDDPAGGFRVLLPREENHEYHADHRNGLFYIVTNRGAKNFRVVTAPVSEAARWTELVPHRAGVKVEGIDLFATHLIVEEREAGLPALAAGNYSAGPLVRFPLPDAINEVEPAENWEFHATEYRFKYQSLARPASVLAGNFATLECRSVKVTEVRGGFRAADYCAERAWAVARDGVRVPLSVVYRRDVDRTRPQPLFLYGYGSYGLSMPAAFSSSRISLLDRGLIYVIAHIRGGGELGEPWREAGRMDRKMTTFHDFVDCAQWLVDRRWTTPAQLVISGGSAGGLLVGASLNLRPDLFRAALLEVPFVDVLNTMLDASLPLTTEEYVEWGNPHLPEQYRWMREYSPYDNLGRTDYPHLLVNVSLHDSQVPYWEGAKYVAKVRDLNTAADRAVLLHTNFAAGHGGPAGRFDALRDTARNQAFLLMALGLGQQKSPE